MVLGVVFVAGILASVTSNVSVSTNASESVNVRVTNKVRSSSETKIQERESLRLEYKQEVDGAREEYRVRLGELKENISVVRDEGKRMAIENINTRVYNTNLRWVERWNAVLEKLSGVLDMVEEELGGSGYGDDDREAVREKVESARDVLNDAQLAINEQAGKSYIVELDSELNLGEQVSGFVRSFKSDLKLVRDSVAEAREAVAEAVKALRSIS